MAQKVTTRFIDDLDGSEAAETVSFALDGRSYEIDLSAGNTERLRSELAPFIGAARKAGFVRRTPLRPTAERLSAKQTATKADNDKIREWANANGMKVSERGRIPARVQLAYAERDLPVSERTNPQRSINTGTLNRAADAILRADDKKKKDAQAGKARAGKAEGGTVSPLFSSEPRGVKGTAAREVTDQEIIEWAKAKGIRVRGGKVTGPMREHYAKDNPGVVFATA